ncbi:MAG: alpha-ketoglutarate-dependent dioxygenase AlkB [Coleofasciculus sp. A1-SPW-01]|uniref:alpha-ketoglutarate-dependent dioxygenase AlkB n=1 Tax=Coleofasciculus sp. A1-SPW-01 TaxID=3070819 RepID=UPI0032FDC2CC
MIPSSKLLNLDVDPKSDFIVPEIPGLNLIHDYINTQEQNQLLEIIDQQEWSTQLKRRVQHYGYRYEYQKRTLTSASYLGELPNWANQLGQRLVRDRVTPTPPDQLIINEYLPGQGITNHVDCVPCFGNTIISLSLGSCCVMNLTHPPTQTQIPVLLLPGSLLILQRVARYQWQHGIPARKNDKYQGREFGRSRRVSLTFREVVFPYK